MFQYSEKKEVGNPYRQAYYDGINALIERKSRESADVRAEYRKEIFDDPKRYRRDFREMLGWPLTETFDGIPEVEKTFVTETDGVKIYRTVTKILDCVPFYGMLFILNDREKTPLVIASHGGLGTPERASGIIEGGSGNYTDMVHRVVKYGVNVYAPQLLLWDPKEYGVPAGNSGTDNMRHSKEFRLKHIGSSITALEVHAIERTLDWLCAQDWVDENRIGMIGLSYGGFYTLFCAAADTRIKASVSAAFFNDRFAHAWYDWTWKNSANMFSDVEVLSLVYPRKICLEVGTRDELFSVDGAIRTFDEFKAFAKEKGNYASLFVFDGTHELSNDDTPIREMIDELKK